MSTSSFKESDKSNASIPQFDTDSGDANFLVSANNQLVSLKNFSTEIRSLRDVEQFIEQSTVLLDVHEENVEQLLVSIIEKVAWIAFGFLKQYF